MIETGKQFGIDDLRGRIARYLGPERVPKQVNVIADTSDFYRVDYDDVVILGDRPYLIRKQRTGGPFRDRRSAEILGQARAGPFGRQRQDHQIRLS